MIGLISENTQGRYGKFQMINLLREIHRKGLFFSVQWVVWGLQLRVLALTSRSSVDSKYNVKLTPNYNDATFRLYVFGGYGHFLSAFLSSLSSNFVFLDIGSNQGLYTIIAAKNPHCKQAIAFEPIDETFKLLQRNLELNNVMPKCIALPKAIDSLTNTRQISFNPKHTGSASLANQSIHSTSHKSIETIDHSILNHILSDLNEDIFVKVDVEGHEFTVLSQLLKTHKSGLIRGIFYEVDTRWTEPEQIEELLREHGFSSFDRIGTSTSHYDIFATV